VVIAVLRRSPTIVGVRARIDFTARTLESPVRVCRRCPHVSVSTTSTNPLLIALALQLLAIVRAASISVTSSDRIRSRGYHAQTSTRPATPR
jgi:hypothetical protein